MNARGWTCCSAVRRQAFTSPQRGAGADASTVWDYGLADTVVSAAAATWGSVSGVDVGLPA